MLERILAKLTVNMAVIAALALALAVQTVRIEGFKVWPISIKGLKADNNDLRGTIRDLESKSRQQQVEVREVIKQGKDRIVTVEKVVREIEKAPLPGNCGTPKEVLQADL